MNTYTAILINLSSYSMMSEEIVFAFIILYVFSSLSYHFLLHKARVLNMTTTIYDYHREITM